MITSQRFLVCQDEYHADFVDHLIMARLMDIENAHGSRWSGVSVKSGLLADTYGVLWAEPASSLFGQPYDLATGEGDPAMVIATEILDADGNSDWGPIPDPAA